MSTSLSVGDVVQDITLTNLEDDDTGRDYLCPRTQAPASPTVARPLDKPRQVVMLPSLFTRKVGARLSLFYDVWR